MLNYIDKIGDWNPQLLRELKGRFKFFPVAIALAASLVTQLMIFIYQLADYPSSEYSLYSKYCKVKKVRNLYPELKFCPKAQIDFQLWWRDHWEYIFLFLSIIFIFILLVGGTYLIVNDLAQEERRGTLNFIRLSPQSETSVFIGKMLGVPALIYLVVFAAIPFHILAGIMANIAFSYILFFYLILVASCIFFYSIASLFGIFGGATFSGFKPWLASGVVLMFLWMTTQISRDDSYHNYIAFFRLFSPSDITNYLFPNLSYKRSAALEELEFFNFALGSNVVTVMAIHLGNYALWTYWAWQGLKRCFRNPNATIFSKLQSYLIIVSCELMLFGFYISEDYTRWGRFDDSVYGLYIWNLFLMVPLFAILLPHRQAIQDWARFRHQTDINNADYSQKSLISELIFGEKSPAILAVVINFSIIAGNFFLLFLNKNAENLSGKINVASFITSLLILISLITIYATIAQIMLMLKNSKRVLWAMGTTSVAIILPIIFLAVLRVEPENILWQFTLGFFFAAESSTSTMILTAFVCQLVIIGLLNWYLIKQVKSAGESATKALFSQARAKA